MADGREPVRDDDRGASVRKTAQRILNRSLCECVKGACSLVENKDCRIFEESASVLAASFTPAFTPLPSLSGGVNSIPTFGGGMSAPYTRKKPLAPNCGASSEPSAADFATGR